jgi:hypothetical protein
MLFAALLSSPFSTCMEMEACVRSTVASNGVATALCDEGVRGSSRV